MNTFARTAASSSVKRSNSRVANPRFTRAAETSILRGLNRLEPLPCANRTRRSVPLGTRSVPGRPAGGIAMSRTSPPARLAGSSLFVLRCKVGQLADRFDPQVQTRALTPLNVCGELALSDDTYAIEGLCATFSLMWVNGAAAVHGIRALIKHILACRIGFALKRREFVPSRPKARGKTTAGTGCVLPTFFRQMASCRRLLGSILVWS